MIACPEWKRCRGTETTTNHILIQLTRLVQSILYRSSPFWDVEKLRTTVELWGSSSNIAINQGEGEPHLIVLTRLLPFKTELNPLAEQGSEIGRVRSGATSFMDKFLLRRLRNAKTATNHKSANAAGCREPDLVCSYRWSAASSSFLRRSTRPKMKHVLVSANCYRSQIILTRADFRSFRR